MSGRNNVAILGAGAMGAAYASRCYAHDPASISFVARGERAERLRRDGLTINGTSYSIPVITPDDDAPPADLILVALKHHHLADALPLLDNRVGEQTIILSVMNGLDSEHIIAERYGWDRVLHTIAVGIDAQRQGSVVHFSQIGQLHFGEANNTTLSDRVRRAQAILDGAGIPYLTPVDMIRTMWWKFMINVGVNQASTILGSPYRVFQTSRHAQHIMESAMREVIALAEAAGVNLVSNDVDEWYAVLNTLHPDGKTSMLQDMEAGRTTEVDIFAGKVIALGQEFAIPTPVNKVFLHAIKVLEQRQAEQVGKNG